MALPCLAFSQDKKIDQLEVLYSQQHYTKVIRKANKLLAIPDYDYSGMPTFYKSIATFKLLTNQEWSAKHKTGLTDAISLYNSFLSHPKQDSYTKSHYFEIAELKQYLVGLEKEYASKNKSNASKQVKSFCDVQLNSISAHGINPQRPKKGKSKKALKQDPEISLDEDPRSPIPNNEIQFREEIVGYAMQYIGTPYVWAGNTPKGFDCSGYIGFVYKNYGISVPRSAASQKEFAQKLNEKEAQKGDLIFFKTGNKVTHVGIIISDQGEPLKMVHSSSSKGIMTTEVHTSNYWSKKFAGVGRIIK